MLPFTDATAGWAYRMNKTTLGLHGIFKYAHLKFTVYGRKHTHNFRKINAVALVWGSLRLAPIIHTCMNLPLVPYNTVSTIDSSPGYGITRTNLINLLNCCQITICEPEILTTLYKHTASLYFQLDTQKVNDIFSFSALLHITAKDRETL